MSPEFVLAGFVVGALVGLTGMGGGSIMTPLLVLMNVNPLIAVGSDLLSSVPTRLYGAYLHNASGTVDWEIVKALLLGGVPSAALGLLALWWLRDRFSVEIVAAWTRPAIGVAVFGSALALLLQPFDRASLAAGDARRKRLEAIALGAFAGASVTMTSIGSGSIVLPLLALAFPVVRLQTLVGSDIAFAALLIPIAAAGRWSMGDVDGPLTLNLLAGSLPGVWIGSRLCARLQQRWLRPAVALTLMAVGLRMV
ncbi:MAG: sulfite exporter TauE/SafE family protein [Candidatus Tyrphobacter sp.]